MIVVMYPLQEQGRQKMGGLNFLLRCNYDAMFFNGLPIFYKRILDNFNELKTLYNYYQKQDIVFNNKEILVGGKPIFISEGFKKGIISVKDLLTENGNFLIFQEFSFYTHVKLIFFSIIKW